MRHIITTPANRTAIRWSLLLAAAAAVVGCGKTSQLAGTDTALREKESRTAKPTPPATGQKGSPSTKPGKTEPDRPQTPADFSLTAKAFYDEVTGGISAAAKKYGGKVVELTGKVALIGRNPVDPKEPPSVTLGDGHYVVICTTADKRPWDKCVPGQTVKVRGTVNGSLLLAAVGMQDCQVTVVSGDPALPVTAEDLVNEIAADEKAARKKYDGKVVLLSGELAPGKKGASSSDRLVELKGDGKRSITCMTWSGDEPFLKKVKAGEPVTFLGELKLTGDKVELKNALLTKASVLGQ
jgi:hypothetical protein